MSQYTNIVENSIMNLMNVLDKLSEHDQQYAQKQLMKIINHANRIEKLYKQKIAKHHKLKEDQYDDTLDYLIDVVALMGCSHLEMNYYLRDDFAIWFRDNALHHPKYEAHHISFSILKRFGEAYRIFTIANERQPNDYWELRNFMVNLDDELGKLHKKELDTLLKMEAHMQKLKK